VMESSRGSFQAILKVAAAYPKAAVNRWFKDLNRARGDERITGLRHPFRLAGFENRKEKHLDPATGKYPFVRLVSAVNTICGRAKEVVHQYALDDLAEASRLEAEAARRAALSSVAERRTARQAPMSGPPRP
jgi:hypothetical protein